VVEVFLTPEGTAVPAESETPSEATTETAEISREGLAPEIWVIGLIAVIVILLVLFGVAL
jgi:hypothetical protein